MLRNNLFANQPQTERWLLIPLSATNWVENFDTILTGINSNNSAEVVIAFNNLEDEDIQFLKATPSEKDIHSWVMLHPKAISHHAYVKLSAQANLNKPLSCNDIEQSFLCTWLTTNIRQVVLNEKISTILLSFETLSHIFSPNTSDMHDCQFLNGEVNEFARSLAENFKLMLDKDFNINEKLYSEPACKSTINLATELLKAKFKEFRFRLPMENPNHSEAQKFIAKLITIEDAFTYFNNRIKENTLTQEFQAHRRYRV